MKILCQGGKKNIVCKNFLCQKKLDKAIKEKDKKKKGVSGPPVDVKNVVLVFWGLTFSHHL